MKSIKKASFFNRFELFNQCISSIQQPAFLFDFCIQQLFRKQYLRKTRLSKDLSLNLALSLLPKLPETLKTLSQATEVGGSFKRAAYNFSILPSRFYKVRTRSPQEQRGCIYCSYYIQPICSCGERVRTLRSLPDREVEADR